VPGKRVAGRFLCRLDKRSWTPTSTPRGNLAWRLASKRAPHSRLPNECSRHHPRPTSLVDKTTVACAITIHKSLGHRPTTDESLRTIGTGPRRRRRDGQRTNTPNGAWRARAQLKKDWYARSGVLPAENGGGPRGTPLTTDDLGGVDSPDWRQLAIKTTG
jgi:hypothetical protein